LTSDTLYIFGGTGGLYSSNSAADSIEQYSVATDTWTLLKIRLPHPISFLVSVKLSGTKILLMGGSVKATQEKGSSSSKKSNQLMTQDPGSSTYKTNSVLLFDVTRPSIEA
jgi:N-acetylneuraminic acid mutarotase